MCSGGHSAEKPKRERTREDIARDRATAAYAVEDAQQRFNNLDRELREFDLIAEAERRVAYELNAKLDDLETKDDAAECLKESGYGPEFTG